MTFDRTSQLVENAVKLTAALVNTAGVAVLVVMMLFTTSDVCLRYFFNSPILGGYELTQLLMVIFVSFALAYTAAHKGHVSVELVVPRLRERAQAVVNSLTTLLSFEIFLMIAWRNIVYGGQMALAQQASATWQIPFYPFYYVVAAGSIIICFALLSNLIEYLPKIVSGARPATWLGSLVLIIVVIAVLNLPIWGAGYIWKASPLISGLIGVIVLLIFLFAGMSVGSVMTLIGFLGMVYVNNLSAGYSIMASTPLSTFASYDNSVIPLFVLMGAFCFQAGLSQALFFTAYKWLGHLPGGLAMASVAACAGFAAVSGSSVATASTMGTVALPEMKKYNYAPSLATGAVAAGGTIGILIPPSIPLVIYGVITEQSIGKLFLAAFIPGILEAVFYIVTIYIMCKTNPSLGPPGQTTTIKEKVVSLKDTWGVVILFVIVIGGIYFGVFTPTEAAGVGAFGAFLFALAKGKLKWSNFVASLKETSLTAGMALLILLGGVVFGYFIAVTRFAFDLATIVSNLQVSSYVILAAILLVYLFLGAIMSGLAMIIITVPIFFPVITALGFNPIWFGIIIVRLVEIGQITPPVGINVFVIKGIAKDVPLFTIFKGIVPFLIADILHVAMLIAIPQITLFLPSLMQ